MQGCFNIKKSVSVIHYINILKKKVIFIYTKNTYKMYLLRKNTLSELVRDGDPDRAIQFGNKIFPNICMEKETLFLPQTIPK